MTQKISPAVFSSATRMASTMRNLSASEIIALPAPRGPAAHERAAAAGKPAAEPTGRARPGGPRRPPRARNRDEDRAAGASSGSRTGLCVSTVAPGDAAYNHEENEQEEHEHENIDEGRFVVRPLSGARLPCLRIDRHGLDDVVHPATDTAGEVIGPKTRDDGVLDDEPGHCVGERPFKAVTHLDTHLALVRRHNQQGAGIFLLLTDLPVTPELVAIILDRRSLQRLQRDHDELAGGLALEIGELLLERGFAGRIENSGVVNNTAGERREGQCMYRVRSEEDQEQAEERTAGALLPPRQHDRHTIRDNPGPVMAQPPQNFTVGGRFTSSATMNVSIGLWLR